MEPIDKKVYLAALSYSFIIGLAFLFGKIALKTSNPLDLLTYRFTASFLVVLILILFKKVKLNYTKERVLKILPLAILYPLLFFSFQTYGLQYTMSSEASIIQAVLPVFTLILATYFLKEKTTLLQKLSIVLSVLGVVYIAVMKGSDLNFNNLKGIIFLTISALSFSGYSVMARGLTKDFSSFELSCMMITISFICFNVMSLGNHILNGTLSDYFLPLKSPSFIIAAVYLGIVSTLGTSLLVNYVLSKMDASKMSVFSNLSTVVSIFAGIIVLREELFYYHIIGTILVIGGVLGANFLDNKNVSKTEI